MSLVVLDKRVMNHLTRGGSVYDDVGRQLVAKFVNDALKTPSIREAMHRH